MSDLADDNVADDNVIEQQPTEDDGNDYGNDDEHEEQPAEDEGHDDEHDYGREQQPAVDAGHDDGDDYGHEQQPAEDDGHDQRPMIELFVKAAADKMKNGGCPMCHRYFMIFYILRDAGLIDLVVTTFLPESPPKEVLEFSHGKRYPLVKVRSGMDSHGHDITGVECDNVVEIEALLERFDCELMNSSKESQAEAEAEKTFSDLYMKFCQFIKTELTSESQLVKNLKKVEAHLRENGSRFMCCDNLTRADCYLLPTLQHIRVAGKAYKNFEIPTEMRSIWQYLKNAYMTDAFLESCPADREIITHYTGKISSPRLSGSKFHLLGEDRTLSIPDDSAMLAQTDDYDE